MKRQALVLLIVALGLQTPWAASQPHTPSLAWEKQFPGSIDWYVPTSSGVLLVRTGKTLYAVDGRAGRELWSMKNLDLGPGNRRGNNLMEVPGTTTLLVRNASGEMKEGFASLLAVDIWTGASQSLESEFRSFFTLLPLYDRGQMLLVTGPLLPGLAFKARLVLRDMFQHTPDKVVWRSEYPGQLGGKIGLNFAGFYVHEGQLYVYKVEPGMGTRFEVGRVDLQTGKRVWNFVRSYLAEFRRGGIAPLLFMDGKIILAGKDVFALDPSSGEPLWTAKDLGKVSYLVELPGVILGFGEEGAFGLDVSTGVVRWRVPSKGYARGPTLVKDTNQWIFRDESGVVAFEPEGGKVVWQVATEEKGLSPVQFEESGRLAVCGKSELVAVNMREGKIAWRRPHGLTDDPVFARRIGHNFLLVATEKDAVLFELTSGQVQWKEKIADAAFPPVAFLEGQPLPEAGSGGFPGEVKMRRPGVGSFLGELGASLAWQFLFGFPLVNTDVHVVPLPGDLKRQLQGALEMLKQRADGNAGWRAALEHLEPFVRQEEPPLPLYATKLRKDEWRVWRVNPAAGQRQEWILPGEQPDYIAGFGLACTFKGKTLQAFKLADD